MRPIGIAELHLHLEGSLFPASAIELTAGGDHPWSRESAASLRKQFRYESFDDFLRRIRQMCAILCSSDALERTARELSVFLSAHGVLYAELYVSPYIYMRTGIGYAEVIDAVVSGCRQGEKQGGAHCVLLLDSVRHWGREAAEHVIRGAADYPHEAVIGFGLGGSETPPLEEFVEIFDSARRLGLQTVVHAGETGQGLDVRKAVDLLGVARVAHGIRALESDETIESLRQSQITLDLAVTSNYRTRVVTSTPHPIRALIDHGVAVSLSTDDPSLFRTDPIREYRRARRFGHLSVDELFAVAETGVTASFATPERKKMLLGEMRARREIWKDAQ